MIKEERGKSVGYCNCGFKRTAGMEISSLESGKNKITNIGQGVVDDSNSKGFLHTCGKCWYEFSEVLELCEILESEASVCLYKCKKCGHVAREK
jgi:hypothetical protein